MNSNLKAWVNLVSGRRWSAIAILLLVGACSCRLGHAETVIYSTGFEASEGYNSQLDLAGQNGWLGTGGNGLLTNFFTGFGQQAYLGFRVPPGSTNEFLSVYHPVNLAPISAHETLVKFSVRMQVVDSTSTNGPWDSFRWSAYNTNGTRLFSLDFDNASLRISYALDDGLGFVPTDLAYDTLGFYELIISMNFARNLWTATLNDQLVVNAKPITTVGTALNLGDISPVWALRDPAKPGDNFLLFDDYRISAGSAPSIAAKLEAVGMGTGGVFQLRLSGEPGLMYRVESSSDLLKWEPLLTFTAPPGGVLDFQDSSAPTHARRFYRARQGL